MDGNFVYLLDKIELQNGTMGTRFVNELKKIFVGVFARNDIHRVVVITSSIYCTVHMHGMYVRCARLCSQYS